MEVTLKDVAAAAGVSTATASRVFADSGPVREQTRRAVLDSAERLGYAPGALRRLPRKSHGTIGLALPTMDNQILSDVVTAFAGAMEGREQLLVVQPFNKARPEIADALAHRVDGVIVWASQQIEQAIRGSSAGTPTVLVNKPSDHCPAVLGTTVDGMRQAVEHLQILGHRHCGYVMARPANWIAEHRARAVRQACRDLGIDLVELGPYQHSLFDAGVHAADLVLASEATGVIAHNDIVAAGLLRQLHTRGISVPDQMSVIGADDTYFARITTPALTSVHLPVDEIAEAAVRLLLDQIAEPLPPGAEAPTVEVPSQLIIRDSSGPPRPR